MDDSPSPFERFLLERRGELCKSWLDRALSVYSDEYRRFLSGGDDRFANPVGAVLKEGLERTLEVLAAGGASKDCAEALEPIIRIRAVQEQPPSEALAFVPLLKSAAREVAGQGGREGGLEQMLTELDARVDALMLVAFDVYTECRQAIFELRVNEFRRNAGFAVRERKAKRRRQDLRGT